jgi:peptide/nickel transport system substrate-binding protein
MRSMLLALALLLGVALPAFGSPSDNTLRIALREDPDILDPTLGSSYVGRIVFAGMCDKLFDYNKMLDIVPQLATSYEYKDPTHLILHLRSGVLFQDGEKLDAAAVKYSLERHLTMPRSLRRGEINVIQSINVVDPLTVELVLKQPNAALLSQLADRSGIVVAPEAAQKEGADFGQHPVCAGPFKFVDRVPQQKITLERFKRYWNARAIHFDKVEYIPIVNSAVRLANLQAGAVDLAEYIVPTDVPAVQKDPKLRIVMGTSLAYNGITFNTGNGPESKSAIGSNAKLRRAFEAAISRNALNHVVYGGLYLPVAQADPPSSQFYVATLTPPKRDIKAAEALVAASGVKPPIPVQLLVPNSPDLLQAAQVIQAMVQPAGFNVTIQAMEFASSLAAARAGNFQAYLIGWSGRADADGNTYSFLHSDTGFNYGKYANPDVDALLEQARVPQGVPARRAIYAKLWTAVRKDMPIIYLWSPQNIVGLRRTVRGFRPVPDGIIRLQGMSFSK